MPQQIREGIISIKSGNTTIAQIKVKQNPAPQGYYIYVGETLEYATASTNYSETIYSDQGVTDETFRVKTNLTREQMATITLRPESVFTKCEWGMDAGVIDYSTVVFSLGENEDQKLLYDVDFYSGSTLMATMTICQAYVKTNVCTSFLINDYSGGQVGQRWSVCSDEWFNVYYTGGTVEFNVSFEDDSYPPRTDPIEWHMTVYDVVDPEAELTISQDSGVGDANGLTMDFGTSQADPSGSGWYGRKTVTIYANGMKEKILYFDWESELYSTEYDIPII